MTPRTLFEPFKIKMVESIRISSPEERRKWIQEAGYNPFLLRSEQVMIDLLTDSGTGAMSDQQWAGMMVGDESYAGSKSWIRFEKKVQELSGMQYILPTHQGRAAERILYGLLGGKGKTFLSNSHFDTTRANIEYTGAEAIDLMENSLLGSSDDHHFKGNLNLEEAEAQILQKGASAIGALIMTLTNNTSGGQPVSFANLKKARQLCDQYGLLLVIDGCRIAENSYFIKHFESGFEHYAYDQIAQMCLGQGDVFVMSAKKDALVNMGGILAMKDESLARDCKNQLIISEGFTTYGGLSGRDMEAIAIGLEEVFDPSYLEYRIRSTAYLGKHLREAGVPVVWPIGGHAVYIDGAKFYPEIPAQEFPAQQLCCDLYQEGGVRTAEIGSVMFGHRDEKGAFVAAPYELLRLAIPRRVYTQSHIDFTIEVFEALTKQRDKSRGLKMIYEPPFLRHFTARFESIGEL